MNTDMVNIEKLPLTSMNVEEDQVAKLKEHFPEVFGEGNKIDWDKLRLTLGENVEIAKERYGMNWPGKAECFKTIQQPSIATLVPDRESSVNFDTTENLFIEGDNLEVLKLLQKSYLGNVKMIYIDPPYNTGNDFIYPDNYAENLSTYLEYTGQLDSEGRKFATNTEMDGRFHSKWINMMYPRLFLAKNLLREDGIVFISIDEAELGNLLQLCNEIFGEENRVGTFVWQSKKGGGSDSKTIVQDHEYILCYGKGQGLLNKASIESEPLDKMDDKGPYRLGRELNKWGSNSRREDRPTMWFSIPGPDNKAVFPIRNDGAEGRWRFGKTKMYDFVKSGNIEFVERKDGSYIAYEKIRSTIPRQKPFRTWLSDAPATADGSKEIKQLFDGKTVFDFPKPVALLKHLLSVGTTNSDDLVLDFFAGSCSTAQAVLEFNLENEEKDLKFICVQLPQKVSHDSEAYKLGYTLISDVGKERIRRVIKKIVRTKSEEALKEKDHLFINGSQKFRCDLGFKVFNLRASNFKIWDASIEKRADAIQQVLFDHVGHVSTDAQQEAILYELLLKSGFELATQIDKLELAGQNVYSIAEGELLICLEKQLTDEVIRAIAERKPSRVICLDEGFEGKEADALKTNAVQIMRSKGVLNFRTV